jgi:hypothetical protein
MPVGRPIHGSIDYSIIEFPADARDTRTVLEATAAWLDSPQMEDLLSMFDRRLTGATLGDRLTEAEALTRDIFDFRRGGERWEAEQAEFSIPVREAVDAVIARIYRRPTAAPAAELRAPEHALVLGGRLNSCLLRAELLADLLAGGLEVGHVWGLGSRRAITSEEQALAVSLGAPHAEDELDVMTAALATAFESPGMVRAQRTAGDSEVRPLADLPVPVTGIAAAPSPGKHRATTSDTYRQFVDVAKVSADSEILIVTSEIHGPFQHAQALAQLGLPTGARVTTVGARISSSRHQTVRTTWSTAEWLQEIRSAIWSMRLMYDVLTGGAPDAEMRPNLPTPAVSANVSDV